MNSSTGTAPSAPSGYTRTAIAFHWVTALLIAAGFTLGWLFDDFHGTTKIRLINYHKWIGVTVFLLALGRSLWRAAHPPPPLPPTVPRWQRVASELSHAALYVLLFAIPISGWVMSSSMGFSVHYLGVIPLPDLIGKNKPLSWMLMDIHEFLTNLLLYLVGLHALAAIYHHFVQRDRVLLNILGGRAR